LTLAADSTAQAGSTPGPELARIDRDRAEAQKFAPRGDDRGHEPAAP